MREHCARKISKNEWFSVFYPVWQENISVKNIQAGFKRTGIWPVDRDQITEEKLTLFAPLDQEIQECPFHSMYLNTCTCAGPLVPLVMVL